MSQQQAQGTQPPSTPSFQIPHYVLDDLCSRFIINIPEEERQDLIRIFFQIELAHWFYLDFYCAENQQLQTCGIKDFSAQIFHHCPSLSVHAPEVDKILGNWKSYKMSVPTYGTIMLDPDMKYCLLVQGFWAKASWGFPKGKVNESEAPDECAIREVHEETGFDVTSMIDKEDFLENKLNDQVTRLYIVQDVPLDTKFQPKTRKEIKSLQWFPIESLPSHKRDQTPKTQLGLNPNTFFMVIPFVKAKKYLEDLYLERRTCEGLKQLVLRACIKMRPLRKWISNQQTQAGNKSQTRPRSSSDFNKTNKEHENSSTKQYRDKQKLKQQQYFAQMNQNAYHELLQYKETKPVRQRDGHDRKSHQRSDQDKGSNQGAQGYSSPNFKQDKKQQFQILNRDGTVGGKPRRSLATQFDNQGSYQPGKRKGGYGDRRGQGQTNKGDQFMPEAWRNFQFDVDSILACIG